jgi:hypothetical protein
MTHPTDDDTNAETRHKSADHASCAVPESVVIALFVAFAIEAALFAMLARPIIDEGVYRAASELL